MKNVARHTVVLFAFILLCASGTAQSAGVDMQEGEWEMISETSMTMGTMSMPSRADKVTKCLTREDLVPSTEKDCKVVKQKVVGNKVSWRVECKKSEGEGEITYRGATYKGTFKMKSVEEGQTMTVDIKLSGRRLGPCTPGKKYGARSEEAEKYKAMGEQAQAQAAQAQAEQAAIAKKTEAFMKRAVVPAEERGACAQKGCARSPECGKKIGELNLKPGDYEITIEKASRVGTAYTPVKVERKTVYLDEESPVPEALSCGRSASVKWGKEKITWTDAPGGGESKGGIPRMLSEVIPSAHAVGGVTMGGVSYHGNSFEGAVTNTMDFGRDQQSLNVTGITGRRVGDGNPPRGLSHYPSRPKGLLDNPARKLKGFFGIQ